MALKRRKVFISQERFNYKRQEAWKCRLGKQGVKSPTPRFTEGSEEEQVTAGETGIQSTDFIALH